MTIDTPATPDTINVSDTLRTPLRKPEKLRIFDSAPHMRIRRACLNLPGLQITIPVRTIKRIEWNRPDGWDDNKNHVMLVQDGGEAFAVEDARDIQMLRQYYNYCYDSHGEIAAG